MELTITLYTWDTECSRGCGKRGHRCQANQDGPENSNDDCGLVGNWNQQCACYEEHQLQIRDATGCQRLEAASTHVLGLGTHMASVVLASSFQNESIDTTFSFLAIQGSKKKNCFPPRQNDTTQCPLRVIRLHIYMLKHSSQYTKLCRWVPLHVQ